MTVYILKHAPNVHGVRFFFKPNSYYARTEDYTPVAKVEAANLAEAFYLTNSVDRFWQENRGIIEILNRADEFKRSCSVGDVFEDTVTGDNYMVDSAGFHKL